MSSASCRCTSGSPKGWNASARRTLAAEATLTAFGISLVFLIAGKLLFGFLGITEHDFRVGGGIVLLVLAVNDLLFSHELKRLPGARVGVVPIGIPLIMGPAGLTTILVLVNSYGYLWAVVSLLTNMVIVWLVFDRAGHDHAGPARSRCQGHREGGSAVPGGIAVMMIRSGIQGMIRMME